MDDLRARIQGRTSCVEVAAELAAFALRIGFTRATVLLDERRSGVLTIAASGGPSSADRAQQEGLRLLASDAGMHAELLQRLSLEDGSIVAIDDDDFLLGIICAGRGANDPAWPESAPRSLEAAKADALAALRYANLRRIHAEDRVLHLNQQGELKTLLKEIENQLIAGLDELERARAFQTMMFAHAPRIPGVVMESVYRPADAVSGDFYDIFRTQSGVRLLVADAAGHGVTAALVTMLLKAEYEGIKRNATSPHEVLVELNARLRSYKGNALAMSVVCIDLDVRSGVLELASAAHPPIVIVHEGAARELEFGGSFLGITDETSIVSARTEMCRGDGAYVYTDGLSEALGAGGVLFGEKRILQQLAERHAQGDAPQALVRSAQAFIRPLAFTDDVTIVGLRYGSVNGDLGRGAP